MDKQLIAMSDCPEMQDGWVPKVGDLTDKGVVIKIIMFPKQKYRSGCGATNETTCYYLLIDKRIGAVEKYWQYELIFLRSQPQLQKILWADYGHPWDLYLTSHRFTRYMQHTTDSFNSFEKYWLAFVMWELHSKRWSTEEQRWIS